MAHVQEWGENEKFVKPWDMSHESWVVTFGALETEGEGFVLLGLVVVGRGSGRRSQVLNEGPRQGIEL